MDREITSTLLRGTRRFTIDELAAAQGVKPMQSTEEWAGDSFETGTELEEFLAFVRESRSRSLADMADSYVCRTCQAGWIEPDEPEPISWVRPYWVEG